MSTTARPTPSELEKGASSPTSLPTTTYLSTPDDDAAQTASMFSIPDKDEIERLGRIRPEVFRSNWSEIGFVMSICMAQILVEYFVSGFNVMVPSIAAALHIPSASTTWPASAFSLVIACFLLPMGRLSDMYGGKLLFVVGVGWLAIWSLVAGSAQSELMVDLARALSGLGPAAFLPSSVMLLGSVYRPGPRKNLVFSVYGACAPLGFFVGIFFAGLSAQLLSWRWYFYIGAAFSAVSFLLAWVSMPSDKEERAAFKIKMDWPGTFFIVSGLVLLVFALTDCAAVGWRTPYIPITFSCGVVLLGAAVYWEGWRAEQPLLPRDIFNVKMFPAVVMAMFMQYGGLGIFLLYSTYYMTQIMGGQPLQLVAWFTPMCVGGIIIAAAGGFVLHLLSGTFLMLIAGFSWVIAPLLFIIMPEGANYWAYVFPAMVAGTIGIDISFNITNVFITTGLPKRQQGLAGAIINSNMHLSIAFFLGFAEIINTALIEQGPRKAFRAVFWFEAGLAAVAVAIMVVFVRLDKAQSDLTADEKEMLARASSLSPSSAATSDAGTDSPTTTDNTIAPLPLPQPAVLR